MDNVNRFQQELGKFYTISEERQTRFYQNTELLHACLGLAGETGELIDHIKKHVAYGKPLDEAEVFGELGDVAHVLCRLVSLLGFKMSDVLDGNITKLEIRYPNGYSDSDAIKNR